MLFFFLFWVSPHRSRPCEPIKRAVHSHLPPRASQHSQLHHAIHDYVEPFQSWVAGFAKTAVELHKHLEEGKMWGRFRHSSTPFYWKKQLWSSPVRESKQKLAVLSTIQQQAFKWIFPHGSHNPSTKGEAPSPTPQHGGKAKSLHALFTWSNCAIQPEWNKRESSPLTHSAFHYWLSHAVLSSFSNLLSAPGKKAMFISERQALLGSVAGVSVRLGWTGYGRSGSLNRKVQVCLEVLSDSTGWLTPFVSSSLLFAQTENRVFIYSSSHPHSS